jgi:hypothetical protein
VGADSLPLNTIPALSSPLFATYVVLPFVAPDPPANDREATSYPLSDTRFSRLHTTKPYARGIAVAVGLLVTAPLPIEPTSQEDVGCAMKGDCQSDAPAITSSKTHIPDPNVIVVHVDQAVAAQVVTPTAATSPDKMWH